ncbi:MAG: glycosyltransferase family 4 protein [Balneolales bacterium]
MNILQISPRIPAPLRDGGAVYIYNITKNLSEIGHTVSMASFESNNHEQDALMMEPYCTLYSVPGQFKPYTPSAVLTSTLLRQPISIYHRMNRKIMRKILTKITQPIDVILLEGIHCAWFVDDIRKMFPGRKIVLRQSNVEHLILSRNGDASRNPLIKLFYKDQSRLMRSFEKKAMQQVDAVTAISHSDEAWYFKDVPGLKSAVVPPGAELPKITYSRTSEDVLLAISNWRWQPNMDGLIWFMNDIWPELKKDFTNLRFQVIGDGIPEHLKKHKHARQIEFLGFVDDVEPYRQQATVLVAPLLSGSGVKLKVIEGLASGLPLVTTPFGSEGIEMNDKEHYLLATDRTEFIKHTKELLTNPELRKTLSQNGRQLIREKYSWKAQAEKLERLLEEVVSESIRI